MAQSKTYFKKAPDGLSAFSISVEEFDRILDEGYELIVVTTPTTRYTSDIEEWIDYGYIDLIDEDVEVRALHRSFMVKS
jgi:hypothetical protein